MTPSMQRPDAEEARKELLATIHAGRELGPEMDDALTDRFMEQLTKLRPAGSFDPTSARAQFSTLLNSLRGSDPAGDSAAADGFLSSLRPARPAVPAYAPYAQPQYPNSPQFGPLVRYRNGPNITPMMVIAIVVAVMIFAKIDMWWLIFVLPALFGWRRSGRYRNRAYRDQQRAYRHNRIMDADGQYHPLPPSGPPEIL